MNVSEITDERLNNLATRNAIVPAMLVEVAALAKAEQEHRRAAKVEKVEYWRSDAGVTCKTINDVIVEHDTGFFVGTKRDMPSLWEPITQIENEAAKPKPASAIYGTCIDCGTTHEGSCVNTNEAKDKPENCSCENCGNGPVNSKGCWLKPCYPYPDKGVSTPYFANWIPKPNPQTAGEVAIAIPTLADVPIGAVAVIRTAKAVWESLVVAKSAGYTFVGNSIKWPDTRIVERWYWPQDAVNRMREGK